MGKSKIKKKIEKLKNIPLNYKLLEKSKTTKRFTCYAYKLTANTGIGLNIDVTTYFFFLFSKYYFTLSIQFCLFCLFSFSSSSSSFVCLFVCLFVCWCWLVCLFVCWFKQESLKKIANF